MFPIKGRLAGAALALLIAALGATGFPGDGCRSGPQPLPAAAATVAR
jgi:hypothetical protein